MKTRCWIIAEAGVNHDGSVDRALALVDVASECGADSVKFQTFDPKALATAGAAKAGYQSRNTGEGSQREMLEKLALGKADFARIRDRCLARGIEFLSTPFDLPSLDLLVGELGLGTIKIPSGEITNGPFLARIGALRRKMILSTGMSDIEEIEQALAALALGGTESGLREPSPDPSRDARAILALPESRAFLESRVTLLHCTSEYPAPFEDTNLRAMGTLADRFRLPVGFSDHTVGITAPVAAVALGAAMIEKHFTLDRNLPGPDHRASLEPGELASMVRAIREVEKALGDGVKRPSAGELRTREVARKSLVASRAIRGGEPFSRENLEAKRPGTGLSPMRFWRLLGKPARRDYSIDELIDDV